MLPPVFSIANIQSLKSVCVIFVGLLNGNCTMKNHYLKNGPPDIGEMLRRADAIHSPGLKRFLAAAALARRQDGKVGLCLRQVCSQVYGFGLPNATVSNPLGNRLLMG